ncbi:MAG: TIGR00725 family protein [Candidatus Marinimicrobia bacterium]|nr:TIGR00725 family protein [Candidatus Neomarinimicrobiota bacterium]
MKNKLKIAIIGGRKATPEVLDLAYQAGKAIAESGHILINGGRSGVMEASARGVFDFGGMTIGILPGTDTRDVNPYITVALPTGIGLSRNSIIACSCDGAIAIGGEFGTLSEIAYCKQFNRPVCSLKSWNIDQVHQAESVAEALQYIEQECQS